MLRLAGQVALLEREAISAARGAGATDSAWTRAALVVNADSLATWFLPALAKLPGTLPVAFDLAATPTIVFNRKDQLQHRFLRRLTRRQVEPPVHYVPSAWGFGEAIRLGLGWGMVPEQIARPDLAAGRCVELAPGRHLDVPLHWQHWKLESTVLGAVTAAVRAVAATALR